MSNLWIALQITALGMGLVFAAIILLWGMMAALTSLLAEKESVPDATEPASLADGNMKAQAAAVAVAVALAEEQSCHEHQRITPPAAIISAWQLGMRTRQLSEKGKPVVRKPRKVG